MIGQVTLAAVLFVVGCGGPGLVVSPQPSQVISSPVASPIATPGQSVSTASEIDGLIAAMEAAVRAADRAAYLALVDLSDPVFALEHTRWANDWAGPKPVRQYSLQLSELVTGDGAATGRMTVTWALDGDEAPRTATFDVRFTHGTSGWRYAGEAWMATEAPHFRVLVERGLEHAVPAIVADLPDIYEHVTTTLDAVPDGSMEIKVYADGSALVANTLLSLPDIHGWNEPGEALKLRVDPDIPSLSPTIAHEFSHFVGFDRAGTRRTLMPWWLDEGVATFVAAEYDTPGRGDERLALVATWEAANELAVWSEMAVFEATPLELWRYVYPQGYAMVRYVTETYGDAVRNTWLAVMATEMTIDEATPAALGVTFDQLDVGFRDWLGEQ